MGYYVKIIDSNFMIPRNKLELAHKALVALDQHDYLKSGSVSEGGKIVSRHFAWLAYDWVERSVSGILTALGFEILEDESGIYIEGYDSKTGDEEHFLKALAPYVRASVDGEIPYIEWQGEERDFWRQEFIDGNMVTKVGEIVWGDKGE